MKKINKVLAFALTAVLAASAFFVGCANHASGDGSGNGAGGSGDWTPVINLSESELMSFFYQAGKWETDWFDSIGGHSTYYPEKVVVEWKEDLSSSYSMLLDFTESGLSEDALNESLAEELSSMKRKWGEENVSGSVLNGIMTIIANFDFDPELGIPEAALMLSVGGDISANRKKIRVQAESNAYVYFNRVY